MSKNTENKIRCCENCKYINKKKEKAQQNQHKYGCNKSQSGYMPFWLSKDVDSKKCGCSDFEPKTKNKIVIGIDQSYTRTGITVLCNKQIYCMYSIDFDNCKTNSDKRAELRHSFAQLLEELQYNEDVNIYDMESVTVITERIRLRSQQFLSESYIKATGALVSTIIDVCAMYDIPVYSVDTRSWKAQVVGDSKPLENKYGINPEKYRTILYMKQKGLLKHIVEPYEGRGQKGIINIKIDGKSTPCKINDDKADSYCIAMYGFLPESQQKLKLEQF